MEKDKIKINKNHHIDVYKPSKCNYCNKNVNLSFSNKFLTSFYDDKILCVTYKCPNCQNLTICKYSLYYDAYDVMLCDLISPFEILGGNGLTYEFSKGIKEISPSFVRIYNDTYKAEQLILNEIVLIGYRKAFEFLIRDYSNKKENNEEKKIQINKLSLLELINLYFKDQIENENLINFSLIESDFYQYEDKYNKAKIEDLKQLILLFVSKIESNIN